MEILIRQATPEDAEALVSYGTMLSNEQDSNVKCLLENLITPFLMSGRFYRNMWKQKIPFFWLLNQRETLLTCFPAGEADVLPANILPIYPCRYMRISEANE